MINAVQTGLFFRKHNTTLALFMSSRGCFKPFLVGDDGQYLTYNTMTADGLVTRRARTSTLMVLTLFPRNIPASAPSLLILINLVDHNISNWIFSRLLIANRECGDQMTAVLQTIYDLEKSYFLIYSLVLYKLEIWLQYAHSPRDFGLTTCSWSHVSSPRHECWWQ